MKKVNFLKTTVTLLLMAIVLTSAGCQKSGTESNPPGGDDGPPSAQNPHQMNDPRLVGEWKRVSVSDINWQTDYGVNGGPQNGSYIDYKINADGSGSCVKYIATTEAGSTYTLFHRSSGFFKADKNGGPEGYYQLTYCPTSGIVEMTKNGVSTKTKLTGSQLYRENDPHSARDFYPAYKIDRYSSPGYTDPHHYIYCTYTDKDGNTVVDAAGVGKVTSFVDVL